MDVVSLRLSFQSPACRHKVLSRVQPEFLSGWQSHIWANANNLHFCPHSCWHGVRVVKCPETRKNVKIMFQIHPHSGMYTHSIFVVETSGLFIWIHIVQCGPNFFSPLFGDFCSNMRDLEHFWGFEGVNYDPRKLAPLKKTPKSTSFVLSTKKIFSQMRSWKEESNCYNKKDSPLNPDVRRLR